ncbi:hypothetical protein RMATCC62417_08649 [Rhizopus microsporus]|nr:hypothetical protein RMATCC62417_08649 [Rhizopus microsporus]
MFTVEEEEEKNIFTGLELIEDRGKQVEAHVDTLTYEGLESPILLAQDSAGGCGGMKWEAADVLIDYFIWKHKETSELLDNKTVVELGAGTGLVGLAVAKLCRAKKVILTDQMPMMNLMQENIKLNKLEEKMKAEILNWYIILSVEYILLTYMIGAKRYRRNPNCWM